jgi:hypothetical protein
MQFTKGKVANQRKLERSTQNLSKKRNQYKNASSRAWYDSRQVKGYCSKLRKVMNIGHWTNISIANPPSRASKRRLPQ